MTGCGGGLRTTTQDARAESRANGPRARCFIFKRLAAWTASEAIASPVRLSSAYLRDTTRTRYWASDNSPEMVGALLLQRLEQSFSRYPFSDRGGNSRRNCCPISSNGSPGREAVPMHARFTPQRELARIRSAGGRLSPEAEQRLAKLYDTFPNLPREMPLLAHLYNPSWSGSGYSADIRVLDEVTDTQLLESTEAFRERQPHRARRLMGGVRSQRAVPRAFVALRDALRKGQFSPHRWLPLLSLYAYPEAGQADQETPPSPTCAVHRERSRKGAGCSRASARAHCRNSRRDIDDAVLKDILELWDQMVVVAQAPELNESERPLSELVFSHPLGMVASSLVSTMDEMHLTPGSGLPERFAGRFELLAGL